MRWLGQSVLLAALLPFSVQAQMAPVQSSSTSPISYSSVNQLNTLLSQLQQVSQSMQTDLASLRVDKWKTDSSAKHQAQADVESVQRNLQAALPEIIAQLRQSPENLTGTFKLYRNLDALYDVFGSIVESAGAFGSKDDFQSLQNDLSMLQQSRRTFADRMEQLSDSKEAELARLHGALQTAQAAVPPAAPKKVIVDDTEPPKKPVTKKKTAKKPSTTTPATSSQSPSSTPPQ